MSTQTKQARQGTLARKGKRGSAQGWGETETEHSRSEGPGECEVRYKEGAVKEGNAGAIAGQLQDILGGLGLLQAGCNTMCSTGGRLE